MRWSNQIALVFQYFYAGFTRTLSRRLRLSFVPHIVAIVVTAFRSLVRYTVNDNFDMRCLKNLRDAIFCCLLSSQRSAWSRCSFLVQASIGLFIDISLSIRSNE